MLIGGMSLMTLVTALPAGLMVKTAIETHLGDSVAANGVSTGVDWTWWEEFRAQSTGVASTFEPRVFGFAAVLGNLSDLVDGVGPPPPVLWVVGGYLLIWTFLLGGCSTGSPDNVEWGTSGSCRRVGCTYSD